MLRRIAKRALPASLRSSMRSALNLWRVRGAILEGDRIGRTFSARGGQAAPSTAAGSGVLESWFDANRQGPGVWKWRPYFDAYERHLSQFRGLPVHILEIGVYSGGSLRMWRDYFGPQARIYGIDIEDACRAYRTEGTEILIGDQGDPAFWARVRQQIPTLDIVVDDGSHRPEHQVATLRALLPHLRPGGVFVCEDAHGFGGRWNQFHAVIYGLSQQLHAVDFQPAVSEDTFCSVATPVQQTIASVHQYPYLVVIERTKAPRPMLCSEKHGT